MDIENHMERAGFAVPRRARRSAAFLAAALPDETPVAGIAVRHANHLFHGFMAVTETHLIVAQANLRAPGHGRLYTLPRDGLLLETVPCANGPIPTVGYRARSGDAAIYFDARRHDWEKLQAALSAAPAPAAH